MEAQLTEVITGVEMVALVALMGANILLSIIAAIKKGEFRFRNLADFVPNRVLPLIAYIIVALLAQVVTDWTAAAVTVYAGLVALYGAGIAAAIKSLTGVNIPDIFSEKK